MIFRAIFSTCGMGMAIYTLKTLKQHYQNIPRAGPVGVLAIAHVDDMYRTIFGALHHFYHRPHQRRSRLHRCQPAVTFKIIIITIAITEAGKHLIRNKHSAIANVTSDQTAEQNQIFIHCWTSTMNSVSVFISRSWISIRVRQCIEESP